jgi:lysophospholipase L1-like esterase
MEKFFKSDQEKEEFLNWVGALQSDMFKQAKETLQDTQGAYCCLGVACAVTIPANKLETWGDSILCGVGPHRQSGAPRWLAQINSDFRDRNAESIMNLNHKKGYSFKQIADELLKTYQHELEG